MQLESLWNYMKYDLEVDKFRAQMVKSPNRQKILKNQDIIKEQQEAIKVVENDVAVMSDRMEAVKDEIARLQGIVEAFAQDLKDNPPEELDQIEERRDRIAKTLEKLNGYEQELASMKSKAEARDRQQKEVRSKAAKAKYEYDQIKAVYDEEYKADKQKLTTMRDQLKAKTEGIDPLLLEKYNAIKQHCTPPMALLNGNQCTGCFMELPVGTLREIKNGDKLIECDNCGRILYIQE